MSKSASHAWAVSRSNQRYKMLCSAGYESQRTLTLRKFEDLPEGVRLDVAFAHIKGFEEKRWLPYVD